MTPFARATCVLALTGFSALCAETGHSMLSGVGLALTFMALAGRRGAR